MIVRRTDIPLRFSTLSVPYWLVKMKYTKLGSSNLEVSVVCLVSFQAYIRVRHA